MNDKRLTSAHSISCPRCGFTSACSPDGEAVFMIAYPVDIVRSLYILGGYAMADTDDESIDETRQKPMLICTKCEHWFNLPDWMSETVYTTDKHSMISNPKSNIKGARDLLLEVLKERNKPRGKNKKT